MIVHPEELKMMKNQMDQDQCICCGSINRSVEWGKIYRAQIGNTLTGHNFRLCNDCIESWATHLLQEWFSNH